MRWQNSLNKITIRIKSFISQRIIIDSVIHNDVLIGKSVIVKDSYIRSGSILENNVELTRSIIQKYVRLSRKCIVSDCFIGDYSYISGESWFNNTNIGRFCSIGARIICGRGNHPTNFISNHPIFYASRKQSGISFAKEDHFFEREKIIINNDVWIGDNVFIKDGVTIGNGSIIAAGSVVVNDVPDYAIVGGVPAKIIRYKFDQKIIQDLLRLSWWNWDEDVLRLYQEIFIEKDIRLAVEALSKKKSI